MKPVHWFLLVVVSAFFVCGGGGLLALLLIGRGVDESTTQSNQDQSPYYIQSNDRMVIRRMTDETRRALEEREGNDLLVAVTKHASIETFEETCTYLWIEALSVGYNDGFGQSDEVALYITSLEPVGQLQGLRLFSGNTLGNTSEGSIDLSPIGGLANLDTLKLSESSVRNAQSLEHLDTLKQFEASDTRFDSVGFLGELVGVQSLVLARCQWPQSAQTPVELPPNLKSLTINGTLSGAHEIVLGAAKIDTLERFTLYNNSQVSDLSRLRDCPNLISVSVWLSRPVRDIGFVADLKRLESLNLSGSGVTDLSPLAGHPTLERLEIDNTRVTDLSPLHSCRNLRHVTLQSDIPQRERDALQESVPQVRFTMHAP